MKNTSLHIEVNLSKCLGYLLQSQISLIQKSISLYVLGTTFVLPYFCRYLPVAKSIGRYNKLATSIFLLSVFKYIIINSQTYDISINLKKALETRTDKMKSSTYYMIYIPITERKLRAIVGAALQTTASFFFRNCDGRLM